MTEIALGVGLGFAGLVFLATLRVRFKVLNLMEEYSDRTTGGDLTGREFISKITKSESLPDLEARKAGSDLTGDYLASSGLIRVTDLDRNSLLALAVAAHEVSHASQEQRWYPAVKIGMYLGATGEFLACTFPLLLLFGFLYYPPLTYVGAVLFLLLLVVVAMELSIEIDANRTAVRYLRNYVELDESELRKMKKPCSGLYLLELRT